jgi:DNA polymerase-3 subunit epsilon
MIGQKEPTFDLSDKIEENLMARSKNVEYFKKIIKPSSEELRQHKIYLKEKLKKNFFN